jgi:hypothetical protein
MTKREVVGYLGLWVIASFGVLMVLAYFTPG